MGISSCHIEPDIVDTNHHIGDIFILNQGPDVDDAGTMAQRIREVCNPVIGGFVIS